MCRFEKGRTGIFKKKNPDFPQKRSKEEGEISKSDTGLNAMGKVREDVKKKNSVESSVFVGGGGPLPAPVEKQKRS